MPSAKNAMRLYVFGTSITCLWTGEPEVISKTEMYLFESRAMTLPLASSFRFQPLVRTSSVSPSGLMAEVTACAAVKSG